MKNTPVRSLLFMPAVNERAIAKIPSLNVDAVILDLEDAVHPSQKAQARQSIVSTLSSLDAGDRRVLVRINGLDSPWWNDDLIALAESPVDGIVLPKIESTDQIDSVVSVMSQDFASPVPLCIMLESAAGVLAASALCRYGDPVTGALVGTADLAKDLRLSLTHPVSGNSLRAGLLPALGQCVLAARAGGIFIVDGVFMNIRDDAGLEVECIEGRAMGFDGKTLIHPAQLDITNRVFSPSPDELEQAVALISAWEAASNSGSGVCVVDNKLVEHLHVQQARDLIVYADQIARLNG